MSIPTFNLTNKVALITGASRGIGQAIAEAYTAAGAKVVLSSRKQEALDAVAKIIRSNGGEALPIAAHTGDLAAIQQVVDQAPQPTAASTSSSTTPPPIPISATFSAPKTAIGIKFWT